MAEFIATTVDYYITTHDKQTVTNRILCGDFNCVDNVTLDRTEAKNQEIRATVGIKQLNTLIKNYLLHDKYKDFHPDQTSYPYHNKFHKSYSRIDRLYISEDWIGLETIFTCLYP